MNERIKQLKHQASLWCDMNIPDQFGEYGYGEAWEDKFAELIVRDCRDMFVVNSPSWNLLNEKLEHFGVEE
jgi:hypothetical protein